MKLHLSSLALILCPVLLFFFLFTRVKTEAYKIYCLPPSLFLMNKHPPNTCLVSMGSWRAFPTFMILCFYDTLGAKLSQEFSHQAVRSSKEKCQMCSITSPGAVNQAGRSDFSYLVPARANLHRNLKTKLLPSSFSPSAPHGAPFFHHPKSVTTAQAVPCLFT